MKHKIKGKICCHRRHNWQAGMGLLLYLVLSGPLWAPVSPGWCKNNTFLTVTNALSFGTFASYAGGEVYISIAGLRTTDAGGGVILMGGTYGQAAYTISGCADNAFSIVTPANTTITDGTNTMGVTNFVSFPVGSGILDANGKGSLQFGATLVVSAGQPSGTYTGTYLVEIVIN